MASSATPQNVGALARQPSNKNYLTRVKFNFFVHELPNMSWFVQRVNLPGISVDNTTQATPFRVLPIPGDHATYEELTVEFQVQEDLSNYLEIHDWLRGQGFPKTRDEYKDLVNERRDLKPTSGNLFSDLTLQIQTSANNPNYDIRFIDGFPINLSSLEFNQTEEEVSPMTAIVVFQYSRYEILKVI